ncbi:hypothetical protein [Corynebacterium sp. CTNIH16]|uniref:ApeA N-terminal domain 1-containing protein n=1 Tax=Corynebacterium sp. CTNIH16 TaxID=3068968 RepID=UPI0039772DAB
MRDTETYASKDKITLESFDYKTQDFPLVEDELCVSIKPYSRPSHKERVNEISIQCRSMLEVRSNQNGMSWKAGLRELRNFQELLMLLSWTSLEATNLEGKFRQETSQNESFWEVSIFLVLQRHRQSANGLVFLTQASRRWTQGCRSREGIS